MALPWLYLILAARAFLPLHIDAVQAFLLLVAIIGSVMLARTLKQEVAADDVDPDVLSEIKSKSV